MNLAFTPIRVVSRLLCILAAFLTASASAEGLALKPLRSSGIYTTGETAGWMATLPEAATSPAVEYTYSLKKNNAEVLQSGKLDLRAGTARIEAKVQEPAMLYLEVSGPKDAKPLVAGAAISPTNLQPVVPAPADFDIFWANKIELLHSIPVQPVITPGTSAKPDVEYATVKLNNINRAHVYGQMAKPKREGKFPAMLMLQWAGGPYPLDPSWVIDHAAKGWLVLNVAAHDVPGNMPPEFYAALPAMLKNYNTIYNEDRDRNYFLQMYLGDYRAVDYLASHPDWDGKTLLVMGTSMGGQQSLAVAGLHPQVTHMIVHVPAGADANAALHGRSEGYPNWDASNPKVMETARYFDVINFASRIKASALVSMGFLDKVCPPAGIWTAFNRIPGPKEVVPLVNAAHNHESTPEQQQAYTERSNAWLAALVKGEQPDIRRMEIK